MKLHNVIIDVFELKINTDVQYSNFAVNEKRNFLLKFSTAIQN